MLEAERQARREARTRPTVVVLHDLRENAPKAWKYARVVGRWVWVEFPSRPDGDTLTALKAAGFHWSKRRGAWQHPCGHFATSSKADPRFTYGQIPAAAGLAALEADAVAAS